MKYKLITLLLILLSSITFAQTKVSGIVIDNDNNPVPYAMLYLKEPMKEL